MPVTLTRTQQAFPFAPLAFDAYFPDYLRQYRRSKGL